MKNILPVSLCLNSLVIILLLTQSVKAQVEFAPIGAKWWYETIPQHVNFVSFEATGDTIIHDKTCRTIESSGSNLFYNRLQFFQNGDTVYYYYQPADSFITAFNFSLDSNQTFITNLVFIEEATMLDPELLNYELEINIDSSSHISINETILKKQSARYYPQGSSTTFIEKIGSKTFFVKQDTDIIDIQRINGLRCYYDDDIGLYNTGLRATCDTTFSIFVSTHELQEIKSLQSYPNSTINSVVFKFASPVQDVLFNVYNSKGVKIESTHYDVVMNKVIQSIEKHANGLYMVEIVVGNKMREVIKILKQ